MLFFSSKIVLIKDTSNKKVLIKVINLLDFAKMKISLKLENVHFYIRKEIKKEDSREKIIYKLLIINDYNLENIDLNQSNINQKPANFLYSFTQVSFGNYNHEQFTEVLNDFVGSPRDYKNVLLFDINTYLEAKKINLEFHQQIKFIIFSDHFFTYYLNYIISDIYIESIDFIFIFLGVFIEVIFIFFFIHYTKLLLFLKKKIG